MVEHKAPRGYAVEEPERIVGIEARLKGQPIVATVNAWRTTGTLEIPVGEGSLWSQCRTIQVEEYLTDTAVETVYGPKMIRRAKENTPYHGSRIDRGCGDIYWSPGSWVAAKTAAGAAVMAAEAVVAGERGHAFCIVRPPGHHCFQVPAGFCILNNVVLAARRLLAAGKRVAVLDWDYHFGDGTANALWNQEAVLFTSLHAAKTCTGAATYPARSARDFKGRGLMKATRGRCFNIQWDHDDADDAALAYAFHTLILPALQQFAPDCILISAGYDAVKGDALAGMNVSPAAFGYLAAALTRLSIPIVGVLEGGYDVELLAHGVAETVQGLRGSPTYTDSLDAWLAQEPQPQHRAVVDAVVPYVLGHSLPELEG